VSLGRNEHGQHGKQARRASEGASESGREEDLMGQLGTQEREAARDLARWVGPFHNVTYYAPEIAEFKDAGMRGWWMAYFAYRAAPLGPVPASVVVATFYGFAPRMVERAVPAVWDVMTPRQALELRLDIVDRALRRLLGGTIASAELAEAAALARQATEGCDVAARPLFAGYAALPWPDQPHLQLCHASTLLRELRGDSHAIALAAEGVDGVECHLLMAAQGHGNRASILPIRGWTEAEWAAAQARLVERGWLLPGGKFTDEGRQARQAIEDHTVELSHEPCRRLGPERLDRLNRLMQPLMADLYEQGLPRTWPPPHLLRPAD
jgi:hypothetical protein